MAAGACSCENATMLIDPKEKNPAGVVCTCICSSWEEEERTKWLLEELNGKRPLLPPGLQCTPEVAEVLSTFRILAELPPDSLGAYVISMAHTASDVLAVVLLQVRNTPTLCLSALAC